MVSGSCLCGGIQFQINGQLNNIQVCHCQQCRKAQGTPFATNLPVALKDFTIVTGEHLLQEFKSLTREGKSRLFCRDCGSPVFSRMESAPDVVRVRAGTLDDSFDGEIAFHQYVAQKARWWTIDDDLHQHDEVAPS